ncbi:T-cell surface glycoprotein CD1a [Manis javanica]|nr:T-cell surface glycoprotein CD1a [Manis javanica]
MRGEQEQPGTWQEDVLPSADGTWHLRAVLDVEAEEAADLSCRVRHSSLETRTLFSTGVRLDLFGIPGHLMASRQKALDNRPPVNESERPNVNCHGDENIFPLSSLKNSDLMDAGLP